MPLIQQSGTTLVVTKNDHGLFPGDDVYLDISTGSATLMRL